MRAITLWQPWATLIAMEIKGVETRCHTRFKHLEGQRIAIHAGKKYDPLCVPNLVDNEYVDTGLLWKLEKDMVPFGFVICTAYVSEVRPLTAADSKAACIPADGRFGLVLQDILKVDPPVEATGRQGIWNWEQ